MTAKNVLQLVLINIFPLLLILLNFADLLTVIESPGSYPFGASINATGSIYASQSVYFTFCIIQIVMLLSLISFSLFIRKYKKTYLVLLIINFLLFIYPILRLRD